MPIKIDGEEAVFLETVQVLDGKLVEFSFDIDGWHPKLAIRFDVIEGIKADIKGQTQDDTYLVVCSNWDSPVGTAASLKFGTTPLGRKLTLNIWHEKLVTNNRATIQITAENSHGT